MTFRTGFSTCARWTAAAVAAALLPAAAAGQQGACPAYDVRPSASALDHARWLSADALEGRATASPGARCAAEYVAAHLAAAGLEPAAAGSAFQAFPVRSGSSVAAGGALAISARPLEAGKAWTPFGFASSGRVEAPMVYAGAGVAVHEEGAAPLADVQGRIAVVEAATPGAGGLYADPHFKASLAARRGAAAVLVLLDGEALPEAASEVRPAVGVPAAAVSGAAAREVREAARRGEPALVAMDVAPTYADARNVAAVLRGSDPALADEVVVIGAHYDHLGRGGEGSLAPDARAIRNGADDNASGTAALVEVAERLARERPARTVLFLAFSGEEMGLLGSGHYVQDPLLPLERTVAMLNMDMVGRLRDGRLTVYGTGTAAEWEGVLRPMDDARDDLTLNFVPDGFGPSDHASFYGEGIPVLHFFTNTHAEYHRPEDDWETLDGEGLARVTELVADVALAVAGTPGGAVLALTPVRQEPANPHGGAVPEPSDPGAARGYGPYLGTIPDMASTEAGVRLTGVREGSPAEEGGLRAGDVIVEFAGREVGDLYAYTYALRDHAPGDRVEIVVLRGGERVTLSVVLGERR